MGALQGKRALVTGGATGIGLGIARALAALGCRVAIAGRRQSTLEEAVASSRPAAELLAHIVDVAQEASVHELFAWAAGELGPIDILVNSAGTNIKNRTMAAMRPEQWRDVMDINATGAYYCMREVLPQMAERGDGLIVNISSISGKRAFDLGGVAYCASKFAMSALGTAVGNEYAPRGVRVTNVYPGEVDTPILEHRPNPVSDEHRARILRPEDVGQLVAGLAVLPARAHIPEVIIKPTWQSYA